VTHQESNWKEVLGFHEAHQNKIRERTLGRVIKLAHSPQRRGKPECKKRGKRTVEKGNGCACKCQSGTRKNKRFNRTREEETRCPMDEVFAKVQFDRQGLKNVDLKTIHVIQHGEKKKRRPQTRPSTIHPPHNKKFNRLGKKPEEGGRT